MLKFAGLNWWAIPVATVAAFALGRPWYGPLFGEAWLKAIGKSADDFEPSPRPFIVTFFTTLLTCIGLRVPRPGHAPVSDPFRLPCRVRHPHGRQSGDLGVTRK